MQMPRHSRTPASHDSQHGRCQHHHHSSQRPTFPPAAVPRSVVDAGSKDLIAQLKQAFLADKQHQQQQQQGNTTTFKLHHQARVCQALCNPEAVASTCALNLRVGRWCGCVAIIDGPLSLAPRMPRGGAGAGSDCSMLMQSSLQPSLCTKQPEALPSSKPAAATLNSSAPPHPNLEQRLQQHDFISAAEQPSSCQPAAAVGPSGSEPIAALPQVQVPGAFSALPPPCSSISRLSLDEANAVMASIALPGGIVFMPVSQHSFMFKAGTAWQFPAFAVCLGSSYLQRMMARLPHLAMAALTCPGFEDYATHMTRKPHAPMQPPKQLSGAAAAAATAQLRCIQATCLFIATKVADQVHALGLLRFMLSSMSSSVVSFREAADIELHCLDALEWRLGPFYAECELQDVCE